MRSILLLPTFALTASVALAQDPPPIKMGLWERTTEITMMGHTNTDTNKSCVTPATWQRMLSNATRQRENCKIDNTRVSGGYDFKGTCTVRAGMTVDVNGTARFSDSEHVVTESHSVFVLNGQKHESTIHGTSHFVSSDCGSVKPDEPESPTK